MVRPTGFEPVAYSFGDCRSIQLSYGRTIGKVIMTRTRFSTAVLAAIALFAVAVRRRTRASCPRGARRARTVRDIEAWMAS